MTDNKIQISLIENSLSKIEKIVGDIIDRGMKFNPVVTSGIVSSSEYLQNAYKKHYLAHSPLKA